MIQTFKLVGQVAGSREKIVAECGKGDPVLVVPEPDNRYDPNAIAVFTMPTADVTGVMVSSAKDCGCGVMSDRDRAVILGRQAGYMPAVQAKMLTLPEQGVVGWISAVRYPPVEYTLVDVDDGMAGIGPVEPDGPIGFDFTIDF